MTLSIWIVLAYLLFFIPVYRRFSPKENLSHRSHSHKYALIILLAGTLLFRIILAMATEGLNTDMLCWRSWSSRAASEGPWGFYTSDYFCDYPPGYIYILGILGVLRQLIAALPAAIETLLLKLPAILCDILLCGLLYQKTKEITKDSLLPILLSLLYAFNPAIWMNSAVWGQVDAVFTLFLLFSLLYLTEQKFLKSAIFLGVATVIKPQALLFAPIYLLTIWENRKMKDFRKLLCLSVLGFFGVFILAVFPFTIGKSPLFIVELYEKTLASYPYASVNAFNLPALLGGNWLSIDTTFAGLSFSIWGTLGIVVSIGTSAYIFIKGKDVSRYYFSAALLIFGIFSLGVKMHERYLFPVFALLLFAFIYKRDRRILGVGFALSVLHFINVLYVYEKHQSGVYHLFPPDMVVTATSFFTVLTYLYVVYLGFSLYTGVPSPSFLKEKRDGRFFRRDLIIVVITTLAYSVLAFTNLGNTAAPKTVAAADNIADFGEITYVNSVSVYKGIGDCVIYFEFSEDGETWSSPQSFVGSDCFKWERYTFDTKNITSIGRFVRVRFTGTATQVYEAAFFGKDGTQLPLSSDSPLFDEQALAEDQQLYINSTYFDEIYHARTAYEHLENVPNHYENTHPPLGKHIISLGIRIFGMNPFGWRFMGTVFGILMLPLIYVFAKRLFKSTFFASCAMLLMTFDCMHFAQTRIATIDSYPVFFILLMYFFMYLFYEGATTISFKKMCLYLALSGLSFGLAIASKWIGFYGGAGLAILFFLALHRRVKIKGPKELWVCVLCLLFFVAVPFLVYYLSYFPIHRADRAVSYWSNFWRYQKHMFDYHSKLQAEHPFSSMWYSWSIVYRPIWYYGNAALKGTGQLSSIVSMGNPLIWWASFIAIVGCILQAIRHIRFKKNDLIPGFLSVGYLSQLVPWMLVSRVVFIYHYFASLPFAMLALVYGFDKICSKFAWGKRAVILFLIASGIVFLAFYPVISGAVVSTSYMLSALRWFPSWILGYQ